MDHSLLRRTLKIVDYESLAAIISLFMLSRGLELSGIFNRVAPKIIMLSNGSESRLLISMIIIVALSSSIIMNDTAMFIFIPLILMISKIAQMNVTKAVTLIAISANVGSALTPIGNPQNIIIWRTYGIPVHEFVVNMVPYVSVWIVLLLLFAYVTRTAEPIRTFTMPKIRVNRLLLATSLTLLVMDVILIQLGYAFIGLLITSGVLLVVGRETILSLDVVLIVIFALIFVDFRELSYIMASHKIMPSQINPMMSVIMSAGLSQMISNVPATVLLTSSVKPEWMPLTVGVNLGGTGIIIGSLANFIAVRISGISLKDFHKYSLPYFMFAFLFTLVLVLLLF